MADTTTLSAHAQARAALDSFVTNRLCCKTKAETKDTVDAVLDGLASVLAAAAKDPDFAFRTPFGSFSVEKSDAREGRNPATGDTIQVAARFKTKLKVSKAIKDAGEIHSLR